MSGILLVPIHLDALWLENDLSVVEPRADFSRLPFWDGTRAVNPDVANVSDEIIARPFQDKGLQLTAGVHLHWALPDALTRGTSKSAAQHKQRNVTFPAVPNRWLVSRYRKGAQTPDEQWIVESDYLHPETAGRVEHRVAIPYPAPAGRPPYRYLGRKRPFNGWAEDPEADSLTRHGYQLTAIGYEPRPTAGAEPAGGYGEPTFAAFYPNCVSVFGFYDPLPPAPLIGTRYEVIGWFSDAAIDCLRAARFVQAATSGADLAKAALKEMFGWAIDPKGDSPDRTVCYARLEFDATKPPSASLPEKAVRVAVGNTSTEALSAYLADGNVELEEQLEALHLFPRLEGKKLDIGFAFREARHEKGFTPVSGGTLWSIRPESSAASTDAEVSAGEGADEPLSPDVARQLNQLNLRQAEYDRAGEALVSMQRQLFADWYKYMLCAYPPPDSRNDYPDIDEVRHFVEKNDLLPITREQLRLSALDLQRSEALSALSKALAEFGTRSTTPHVLQPTPAPRYWRPHEPVVLIVDDSVVPTTRHGQDGRLHPEGLLKCQLMAAAEGGIEKNIPAIRKTIDAASAADQAQIGFGKWTRQPWHPFSLEWRVELFPLRHGNNLKPTDRDYSPAFITANYELQEDAVDLAVRAGQTAIEKAKSVYSGSSLLTPHARRQLQSRMKTFLDKRDVVIPKGTDPVVEAIRKAYVTLDHAFHAMAQELSGFNEALLMHSQVMQLPVADPLGFRDARDFTARVRDAVRNQNRSAAQPLDDFHPIRSGALRIRTLRLVDTFGRMQSLTTRDDKVVAAEALRATGAPHLVWLPPRLVQPARLNFRWLSAERGHGAAEDEMEMNAHPATTPICGWLLLNDLDDSLMVYDTEGAPLGSLDAQCQWKSAPHGGVADVSQIANVHLQMLLRHLKQLTPVPFKHFRGGVQQALETIDPEGHAQQEALALLVGRPMAVVRAALDLQVRGRPAVNQDWNVFRHEMARDFQTESTYPATPASRDTDAVGAVQFPIRLGGRRKLNDGLILFWKEVWSPDGTSYGYEQPSDPPLPGTPSLLQSIDSPPVKVTMLIDPRAAVHASSGVLPAKSIRIPADQYAAALRRMAVTFFCGPILTTAGRIELPVPSEPGFAWNWLPPDDTAEKDISPITLHADLDGKQVILEGWLQLRKLDQND